MKHLKLNEDTLLDYEAWGKRIYVHVDNDEKGGYVEMKIGDTEETRDNLSSMKSVSKEYIMKPEPEDEPIGEVDNNTGEIEDIFEWDFDDEEEVPIGNGSDEPIGSTNVTKFKPGDKVMQKNYGEGVVTTFNTDSTIISVKFNGYTRSFLVNIVNDRKNMTKI